MDGRFQLIGAEASYYTGKVRAYLHWKGLPFDEVLATAEVYRTVIVPKTGVRYIPVVITPEGDALQDSTEIIDACERRVPEPSVYPVTPVQRLVALLFEIYGDEWLVLPAMHFRWSFEENREFILREFGRTLYPEASDAEHRARGMEASAPFSGALPLLGVTPETIPAIEAWTAELFTQMCHHLARHPFLLGTRPSIGDFGLLGPLYAHLYRDPYPGRLMREKASRIARWVERLNTLPPRSGDFLPDDEVPETLVPILRRMVAEHLPVMRDTARLLAEWLRDNPGRRIPRVIGFHEFTIGGVRAQRAVFPYTVWMLQRAVDHCRALTGRDRCRVGTFLREIGAYDALAEPLPCRVARDHNRLVVAS
ncbi:MAG: glutathione S-transferase [Candidatus Binatia bacterium]